MNSTAPQELKTLLNDAEFARYHGDIIRDDGFAECLNRFLDSTMDEARTTNSSEVAERILSIIGMTDFGTFRDTVRARELTGKISYPGQRDHSAHTVNNYLLGWYFYRTCTPLRVAFRKTFDRRSIKTIGHGHFPPRWQFFGHVWQYTSLLHDVGYMFEGSVVQPDIISSNEQAEYGANAAREYFGRRIWLEYVDNNVAKRQAAIAALEEDLKPPTLPGHTLGEIADGLRYLGDLKCLGAAVADELKKIDQNAAFPSFSLSDSDAFELWAHNYRHFGDTAMADRMGVLKSVFENFYDKGLSVKTPVRLLDHGVCSGLLLLLAATYYYRLKSRIHSSKPLEHVDRLKAFSFSPAFWWTGIVWASAATALHNIQQSDPNGFEKGMGPTPLKLEDDPLAYLGVLVDTVEEWDRYSVFKPSHKAPMQGNEVRLGHRHGLVELQFVGSRSRDLTKKVTEELDKTLISWNKLLKMLPPAA